MSFGSRPWAVARLRMSATRSRVMRLSAPNTKTHSACVAANSRPRLDEPAWYSTGVPLQRRLGEVNGIHLIAPPVMPHAVDFRGIGEDAVLLVAPYGAVFPTRLPQLIDDGHVLIGGVVPTIVV